jgi:hypothetical protein
MNVERKQAILATADELLRSQKVLDESRLDATFILRFDPLCEAWLKAIREMMRQVIGLDGDDALPDVEAFLWQQHLERSRGLQVSLISRADVRASYSGDIHGKGYGCLNMELISRLQVVPGKSLDWEQLQDTFVLVGNEARVTSIIQDEIERIAVAYGVSPDPDAIDSYSREDIRRINGMIAEWVTRGKNIPAFRWEYTRFIETDFTEDKKHIFVCPPQSVTSRRAELVQRLNIGAPLTIKSGNHLTLQTYSLPQTDFGKSLLASTIGCYSDIRQTNTPARGNKRMTLSVRIRTWSVYYLTKRGGGECTEAEAIEQWNEVFPKYMVQEPNYRGERDRLLTRGSIRRIR